MSSLSESSERDGGIAGPHDRCAVRFEFQCAAGGDAAIVGPGIRYRVDFASGEYWYNGDRGHGIGASSEVAHGNDAAAVLLNRSNVALVRVDEDDVDDGGDGMAEGRVAAVAPVSVDTINSDTNSGYYDGHALDGGGSTVSARGFTAELGSHRVGEGGAGGRR